MEGKAENFETFELLVLLSLLVPYLHMDHDDAFSSSSSSFSDDDDDDEFSSRQQSPVASSEKTMLLKDFAAGREREKRRNVRYTLLYLTLLIHTSLHTVQLCNDSFLCFLHFLVEL